MASILLAIKLGTTTTTIFRQGDGLVLKEPSLIAVSGSIKNREVKAIGYEAKNMVGRTASNVSVISPIDGGLIINTDLASAMLRGFVRKVCPDKLIKPNIRAILCVPVGITPADKKTFQKVCYSAGINDVMILPAIICNAIGLDLDIENNYGKLIVNIGGGCTNIAVIAGNTIVSGVSVTIGGTNINTAIEQYILETYNIKISEASAEKIKQDIASLFSAYAAACDVEGIDLSTKDTKIITITSNEIYPIMDYYYSKICQAIETVINSCPNDIISDIYKDGGHFSGSQTIYPGLEKYLKRKLNMRIDISDMGKTDIWGAGKLLNEPLWLKKLILAN